MKELRKLLVMMFILMVGIQTLHGGSATWNLNPGSGDWNTATNWTPATVPNSAASTATFAFSNTTAVSLSANTEVNGVVFNSGASAFTITAIPTSQFTFTLSGVGIANNSGIIQNFVADTNGSGQTVFIGFTNSATAGNSTMFTNKGSSVSGAGGGVTVFTNNATAGNGVFINNGGVVSSAGGGQTQFLNSSTAGDGAFTNNEGAVSNAGGGVSTFDGTSTAGNGTFTNNGGTVSGARGGGTQFGTSATAGSGTFVNNGGAFSGVGGGGTSFSATSTAGSGTFTNNGGVVSGANAGATYLLDTSTAGNGTFINNGGVVDAATGFTFLADSSTAGNGTFINNGSAISGAGGGSTNFVGASTGGNGTFTTNGGTISGAGGGLIIFFGTAIASNGIFTNNGGVVSGASGGLTIFRETSSAGSSTLLANGGLGGGEGGGIGFLDDSSGATGRVEVFGSGYLDINNHNTPGMPIGSIEGSGAVFLGANNLTVGSNNLNTTFSGVIQDGGANGSFTKVGAGILTFDGGASNDHIGDTVTLSVVSGSIVNLNFSGSADTIGGLIVDGVAQPAGVYGSAASGAPNPLPEFAGTGTIRVVLAPTPTPTPAPTPPVITSPLMATGTVGQPFVYQFEAKGAASLAVFNPPPGLAFNSTLRAIVGFPSAVGTFQIGLSATNSGGTTTRTLTITVQPPPTAGPVIISSSAATGRVGQPFLFKVYTTGGTQAARVSANSLPSGLSIDAVTGRILGTPTAEGSSAVTLTVTDGPFTTRSTLQLTFTVDPALPVISSPSLARLTRGQSFYYGIVAPSSAGPSDPTSFNYFGEVPAGLTDSVTGIISGVYNPLPPESVKGSGPRRNEIAGGTLLASIQLFGTNSHGTSTMPLYFVGPPPGIANISTRLLVGTGDNLLVGGFIVTGTNPKIIIVRALGPSTKIPGALPDPVLELHDPAHPKIVVVNDNWGDSQQDVINATTIPPTNPLESAIVVGLDPGSYTAQVRGKNGATGIAVVEAYDLGPGGLDISDNAKLANIATRGFVDTGENVMIGGFIISGQTTRVIVRAIGPELNSSVPGALQDTTLELYDASGSLIASNDDWRSDQEAEIIATTIPPTDDREAAIVANLVTGAYTAIVRGKDNATGVAVVQVYVLQ